MRQHLVGVFDEQPQQGKLRSRKSNLNGVAPDMVTGQIDFEIADPAQTDDAVSQAETEARLLDGLSSLSEAQIQVVRLAYFHDKSHVTIAAELGLPLGTVKSRLRLALERLRGLIGQA